MKLSHREKVLLWVFGNILVLMVGVRGKIFGISEKNTMLKEELTTLQMQEDEVNQLLISEAVIRKGEEESREQLKKVKDTYFEELEPEKLQDWLMEKQSVYDVDTQSLTLNEPVAYQSLTASEGTDYSLVDENQVTYQLEGDHEEVVGFLDDLLESNKQIVIKSLSFDEKGGRLRISCYSAKDNLNQAGNEYQENPESE